MQEQDPSEPSAPASSRPPDASGPGVRVRPLRREDVPGAVEVSRAVYPLRAAWRAEELLAHLGVFPEGQLVAVDADDGRVLGSASGLILSRESLAPDADWITLTGRGYFGTHDPSGETLYGAGVAVHPDARGRGVGGALYRAREGLVARFRLERILAGARISGYHRVSHRMDPEEYVEAVARQELRDPSLSFQLAQGFRVVRVIPNYLPQDAESLGFAVEVEWRPPREGGP